MRSIATVGGYTLISRILGFIRDILIAASLGAGPVADAFFVAFKLPNFFRRLFAEGAFNAAFVPLFTRHMAEGGKEQATAFAEEVLALLVISLVFFVTALQIAMPWVMMILAPGFVSDPERLNLAIAMAQVTFPYLLFVSIVSQLGGVLNALNRFASVAAAPIILNLCLILALLAFSSTAEAGGQALAWGVAAAGIGQFLWLIIACHREGFKPRLLFPRLTHRVKRFLALMLPGVIGAGVIQINLLLDIVIASLLPRGSISFLYFADRVCQLPLGIVGVAIGTALLPLLTRQIRENNPVAALHNLNRGIEYALLLTFPAAVALMIIPMTIISTLFERGEFSHVETFATAKALIAYAAGLPAYVLIKTLGPGFFAREDTVTPVKVGAFCVALNLGLNLLLMGPFLHVGIALATAISAWINAFLLLFILIRRGHFEIDVRLKKVVPRVLLAVGLMVVVVEISVAAMVHLGAQNGWWQWFSLAIIVGSGIFVFSGAAILFGAAKLSDLKQMLDRSAR